MKKIILLAGMALLFTAGCGQTLDAKEETSRPDYYRVIGEDVDIDMSGKFVEVRLNKNGALATYVVEKADVADEVHALVGSCIYADLTKDSDEQRVRFVECPEEI